MRDNASLTFIFVAILKVTNDFFLNIIIINNNHLSVTRLASLVGINIVASETEGPKFKPTIWPKKKTE